MKSAITAVALFLFSMNALASGTEVVTVTCGDQRYEGDLAKSPVGLLIHNGMIEFYNKGQLDLSFAVAKPQAGLIVASNAKSRPKGNDVDHTEVSFAGSCIEQSVTAQTNKIGGITGPLKSAPIQCLCTYDNF